MATKRKKAPRCPVCKREAHRTKDGWVGAPWRWVCITGWCHHVGDVRHNPRIERLDGREGTDSER